MDKQKLSQDILKLVGGEENISQVTHCMTRLRFNLNDNKKADKDTLKNTPGVMGVMENGGQFQVIIGNDVAAVYTALAGNMSKSPQLENTSGAPTGKKKNPFSSLLDFISGVFTPILPAITGAGVIKGIIAILLSFGWITDTSSTYVILSAIGDGAFYFLPIILAISTARKLGSNIYVSAAIGATIMHPTITALLASGEKITFAGLPVVATSYATSVIPILVGVWLASYVEKGLDKITHASIKLLIVPAMTLLIIVPVILITVGPLGVIVGNSLIGSIDWLFTNTGPFAGFIMGGLFSVLIITGMHYALFPIQIASIATIGYDFMIPIMTMANIAQAGSALGVSLKTKNKKIKALSVSAGVTALMGVTEPAMYGVNMRFKKPFVAALISGAISGAFISIFHTKAYRLAGMPGLAGIPMFVGETFIYAMIGMAIALVISIVLTYIIGFEDVPEDEEQQTSVDEQVTSIIEEEARVQSEPIFSPITGEVKSLSEVPDPAFSEEIMGKGFAIKPTEGRAVSPINGTVVSLSKSGHAIGLVSNHGAEMLIHIGIDTVKLKGQFFSPKVQAGTKVSVGDLLIEFDYKEIEKAGYSTITPVIITNIQQYEDIESAGKTEIKEQELLYMTKA